MVNTGIADLDELLDPLPAGSVTVIASGRGGGRTTLALQLALAAGPAAYLSTGLRANEVAHRVLAMQAGVNGGDVRHGRVSERMWREIGAAVGRIDKLPSVFVVDRVADASRLRFVLDCPDGEQPRTIVLDGIDVGANLGCESRAAALRVVGEAAEEQQAAWVVTVGLSCADYAPAHGDAFTAFLDTLPVRADSVLWFDDDRSSPVRLVEVYNRNSPAESFTLARRPGVPRFYGATPLTDTGGDDCEPSVGYTVTA